MYVPPNTNDLYHSYLFCSLPSNSDLLILGDFNFPDIDWDLLSGESKNSTNFCELVSDLNFCQLSASSTHKAGNILDLILTNNDQLVHDIVIHPVLPTGLLSDHFVITFRFLLTDVVKARARMVVFLTTLKLTGKRYIFSSVNTILKSFMRYQTWKMPGHILKTSFLQQFYSLYPESALESILALNGLTQRFNIISTKFIH